MAYYENKLYLWGGRAASIIDNHQASLYVYDLQSCKWSKIITKCTYPGLESLSSTAHAIHNHKWYLFGGTNQKCEYNTALWKLNVDNYEWKKCEQKGELPPPTEGGHLQFIDKSWMLHYEGFNSVSPAKLSLSICTISTRRFGTSARETICIMLDFALELQSAFKTTRSICLAGRISRKINCNASMIYTL